MKPNANASEQQEPVQSTSVERFQKTLKLSRAAYQRDASLNNIDIDAPMDKTVLRRITWAEKNAQHFAFHREFYEKERSK